MSQRPDDTNRLRALGKTLAHAAPTTLDVDDNPIRQGVEEAVLQDGMHEAIKAQSKAMVDKVWRAVLASPQFDQAVRTMVREACLEIVKEILAESMGDIDSKVRALLDSQWQEHVERAAHAVLSDWLANVRKKFGP